MRHQMKSVIAKLGWALATMCMVIIMCDFAVPRVAGQGPFSMAPYYGTTTYFDIWADDNGNLYGMGSTQPLPNPYNHQGRVTVTLTSPHGRIASSDTDFCCSYAQAQVMLPFDENDQGIFSLTTEHRNRCPIALILFAGVTNFGSAATGQSRAIYKNDFCTVSTPSPLTLYCEFVPVLDCMVNCKPSPLVRRLTKAPTASYRIIRFQSWITVRGIVTCIPATTSEIDAELGTPLTCAELP